ncbi:hypothetical protein BJF79_03100 [Actinomadura sp. CNU-125]|uniref:hypothetical protein n=1 Tax=Actinomadura sp. CNU-125 TaxID=1904961 RepID=UPI00095E6E80|nr:hypothetical protein [Actinomadura sp. CNU-125]OLT14164.1 hypothetical protein BJF79_03100 [Actinomadura sp. CNU-125]
MEDPEIDLSGLVGSMERDLEAEFPGWLIARESTGRWAATRPDWGALFAQTGPELRERLRRFNREDGAS